MTSSHYFVTGTDTDVGKTVACAWLVRHLNADYWKPVQAGEDDGTDTERLQQWADWPASRCLPNRFTLKSPRSPHEAAKRDGVKISLDDFHSPSQDCPCIIEGAGGVLVPLNDEDLMIDLAKKLGAPVILVARTALGTINHTLLSLMALRERQLRVRGVILSGPEDRENRRAIEHYGKVEILAHIPVLESLNAQKLDHVKAEVLL